MTPPGEADRALEVIVAALWAEKRLCQAGCRTLK
jgi:hypothetical protein